MITASCRRESEFAAHMYCYDSYCSQGGTATFAVCHNDNCFCMKESEKICQRYNWPLGLALCHQKCRQSSSKAIVGACIEFSCQCIASHNIIKGP